MSRRLMFLMLACLLFVGCNKRHHTITRGFYYWRTGYALSAYERNRLRDIQVKALYLRCFDVDWDEATQQPKPLGIVRFNTPPDTGFNYTPVVFITQKAIAKLTLRQTRQLASDVMRLVRELCQNNNLSTKEIQIDCDWTSSCREVYFSLLKEIRKQPFLQDKLLSCTIRLHQVKFRMNSGIPPVDRGLLMCYNIGNLKQPGAHNSILDAGLAKNYLKDVGSYPLKLDVALPLFRWCVQFHDGKMIGILRDVSPEDIAATPFFKHSNANLYHCEKDTDWQDYNFRVGDEIRTETPSISDLNAVADFTAEAVRNDSLAVLFFQADSLTLSYYTTHELEAIYHHYH